MGLLSFMILIRILNIADFGRWVLFVTPAALVDMLRWGLTRDAIVRYLSSPNPEERKSYLGSSWILGIAILIVISILLWILILIIPKTLASSGYDIFCYWYPLYALVSMPWNYAWSILQADLEFGKIFWLRSINLVSFLIVIFLAYLFFKIDTTLVVIMYVITHTFTSIFCLFKKWTGGEHIKHFSMERARTLLTYGQFSMLTRIGSSLLKGADSFIISFSAFLGPTGVALYAIPLKYLDVIEIPLISFANTAFPKLSKASLENKVSEFKKLYYSYTGSIVYLFIVIAVISFFLNKIFIRILGGAQYLDSLDGISNILIVFIFYSLLLPLDRFTGVALDSLNKPQKNFYKIIWMACANITGDLVAVFGLHYFFPQWQVTTILLFVAVASIFFSCIGLIVGYRFLKQEIEISFLNIFKYGFNLYKAYAIRIRQIIRDRNIADGH